MVLGACEFQSSCAACTSVTFCVYIFFTGNAGKNLTRCVNEEDAVKYTSRAIRISVQEMDCEVVELEAKALNSPLGHDPSDTNKISFDDQIQMHVLKNYNILEPPSSTTGHPTVLEIRLDFRTFAFFKNETLPRVHLNASLNLKWYDPRLAWKKYENRYNTNYTKARETKHSIEFFEFAIWRPKLIASVSSNISRTHNQIENVRNKVRVEPTGAVSLVYPITLDSNCRLNLIRWPLNAYECNVGIAFMEHLGHGQNSGQGQGQGQLQQQDINNFDSDSDVIMMPLPLWKTNQRNLHLESGNNLGADEDFISIAFLRENRKWKLTRMTGNRGFNVACHHADGRCPQMLWFSFEIHRNYDYVSYSFEVTVLVITLGIVLLTCLVLFLKPAGIPKIVVGSLNLFVDVYCIVYFSFTVQLLTAGYNIPVIFILFYYTVPVILISLLSSLTIAMLQMKDTCISYPICLINYISNEKFLKVLLLHPVKPPTGSGPNYIVSFYNKSKRSEISRTRLRLAQMEQDENMAAKINSTANAKIFPFQVSAEGLDSVTGKNSESIPKPEAEPEAFEPVPPDHPEDYQAVNASMNNTQWILLVHVFERILCILYLLLFVGMLFTFIFI